MFNHFFRVCAGLCLASLCLVALPSSARADAADYEFQLAETELPQGPAELAVKLVDKRSGEAVPDAVIFATRLDMAPDDMAGMTSPLEELPSQEAGVYRFRTKLTMAGGWRLSLAAKVQGESETVQSIIIFKALP